MRTLVVASRELRVAFRTPAAAVFLFFFLLVTGLFFFFVPDYFDVGEASLRRFFELLPWVYLFFAPALTMRTWAEERRSGTFETLMTQPLTDVEVVVGKYLACLALLAAALVLTSPYALVVSYTAATAVDWGPVLTGYLGAFLLGSACVAIGVFASSTTRSQIVAFVVGLFGATLLLLIGVDAVAEAFPRALGAVLRHASLGYHFGNFVRGVVDTRDLVYYGTLTALFLSLNVWGARRRP